MSAHDSILLVEDDPTDVFLMERSFVKAAVTQKLLVATNGMEAIEVLSRPPSGGPESSLPCLVVLDLKLPLKSGLEVLQWIREQSLVRRIPVIIFTSSSYRDDINGAYDRGANGYFLKTGSLEKMRDLVSLWRNYWLTEGKAPDLADVRII